MPYVDKYKQVILYALRELYIPALVSQRHKKAINLILLIH